MWVSLAMLGMPRGNTEGDLCMNIELLIKNPEDEKEHYILGFNEINGELYLQDETGINITLSFLEVYQMFNAVFMKAIL